jgi:hypothetical protein
MYCSPQCSRFSTLATKWYIRRGIVITSMTEDVKKHWMAQRNNVYQFPAEFTPRYAMQRDNIKKLRTMGLTYVEIAHLVKLGVETVIEVLNGEI